MLIFDLDGTLIDSNGVWVEVDKIFLSRRGAPYEEIRRKNHEVCTECHP